jgi:hypothetical protein
MLKSNKLLLFGFLGAFAMLSACGDDEHEHECGDGICDSHETAASCAADCMMAPPVCNSNGTCDDGENFANCAADCNNLCTGMADLAFREGPVGTGADVGAWADTDCAGKAQNDACVGAGMVGAGLSCAAGTDSMTCAALPAGCTWGGDTIGCIATTAATCAGIGAMGGQAGCEMAGCVYVGMSCLPAQAEANCTAGSAVLKASKDFECSWNSTANVCWYPKTGADVASGAASDCGLSCLSNADPVACTLSCMLGADKLGPTALTGGCVSCYAAVLDCTLANCVVKCGEISSACDNMCSEACFTALTGCGSCRTDAGCDAVFNSCSEGT